jgi:hypothetical protein
MSRPRLTLNWVDIEKLCILQCTQEEIAWFAGCSLNTVERDCKRQKKMTFGEFYKQKRGYGRATLRRHQWEAAQKGNVSMLIWLGKQYLGQTDKLAATDQPRRPIPLQYSPTDPEGGKK